MIFTDTMLLSKPERSIGSSCTQNISSEWFEADPGPAGKKEMAKGCGEHTHAMYHNQCHATSNLQSVTLLIMKLKEVDFHVNDYLLCSEQMVLFVIFYCHKV